MMRITHNYLVKLAYRYGIRNAGMMTDESIVSSIMKKIDTMNATSRMKNSVKSKPKTKSSKSKEPLEFEDVEAQLDDTKKLTELFDLFRRFPPRRSIDASRGIFIFDEGEFIENAKQGGFTNRDITLFLGQANLKIRLK